VLADYITTEGPLGSLFGLIPESQHPQMMEALRQ